MSQTNDGGALPLSGGCQCGKVRYELLMAPDGAHFCHCRMCQRAVGNVFAGLAPVRRDQLRWLADSPAEFASSTVARRGFCRDCGTPLTFGYNESSWICVTLGSLDDPAAVPPLIEHGIEARLPYLQARPDCQQEATGGRHLHGMVKQQFELV